MTEHDDWALAPEGVPGDDPFESPWLAEPGAFVTVDDLEPDSEWAEAIDEIDYAEELDPFALPSDAGLPTDPFEPFEGSDEVPFAADEGWDYWSPDDGAGPASPEVPHD